MNKQLNAFSLTGSKQGGAVLIVALVLLLVLTILGTAGIQNTLITERMSGNYHDIAVAFESAEAGLRSGERLLVDASTHAALLFDGTDGSWRVPELGTSVEFGVDSNYMINTGMSEVPSSAHAASSYYLEELPKIKDPKGSLVVGFPDQQFPESFYRVTSKGVGVSPAVEVILQSTYYR